MSKNQLLKFVEIRNQSAHRSNLQFGADAMEAGFDVSELGDPILLNGGGYLWETPYGFLIENRRGFLTLMDRGTNNG